MIPLQQLLGEIKIAVRHLDSTHLSRAELTVDVDNAAVVVLLRTKPHLTERLLSMRRFQYPLPMLLHHGAFFEKLARRVYDGDVALTPSELTRAAFASVHLGDNHGASVNVETGRFVVPGINPVMSPSGYMWAETLKSTAYPSFLTDKTLGVMDLYLIHLPDVPLGELHFEDLLQIAKLTIGWNYASFMSESDVQRIAQLIVEASEKASVIAVY